MRTAYTYKFTETEQKGYYDAIIAVGSALFKSIISKTLRDWCDELDISYEEFNDCVKNSLFSTNL